MQPLRICARLINGYAAKDPWSPALDGIVAAVVMADRLGWDYFTGTAPSAMEPVTGLPFEVRHEGNLWWYAVSSPIIVGFAGREKKAFHRRFDDQHERHLAPDVGRVLTAAGPYKATRLHDTRVICRALDWHVVGDEAALRPILDRVAQVGARRGIGCGLVSGWEIAPGDAEIARTHRPLPAAQFPDRMSMPWGLHPPARLGAVECAMPEERHATA